MTDQSQIKVLNQLYSLIGILSDVTVIDIYKNLNEMNAADLSNLENAIDFISDICISSDD